MNMKVVAAILLLLFIGAFLIKHTSTGDNSLNTERAADAKMPITKKPNDKVVLVRGVNYDELKEAVTQFCNDYNHMHYQLIAELKKPAANEVAITFPYDISLRTFLYFINAINNPKNLDYKADIVAWGTIEPGEEWAPAELDQQKMMIVIAANEDTGINYMITQNNLAYKIGYSFRSQLEKMSQAPVQYRKPDKDLKGIDIMPGEEIK